MSSALRRAVLPSLLFVVACGSEPTAGPPGAGPDAEVPVAGPSSLLLDRDELPPAAIAADPVAVARRVAHRHAAVYRLSPRAIDAAQVASVEALPRGGTLVSLRQRLDGVEVLGHELDVVLDGRGRAVSLSGRLDPRTPSGATPRATGASATAAVVAAYEEWTGHRLAPARVGAGSPTPGEHTRFDLDLAPGVAAGGIVVEPVARARPIWFADAAGLVAAHQVELLGQDEDGARPRGQTFVVAADSGAILTTHELVDDLAFGYRVWADPVTGQPHPNPAGPTALPHPTGRPDGTGLVAIDPILREVEGAPAWLPDDATGTTGNNVEAFTHRAFAPDGRSPAPAPLTAERAFDHRGHDGTDVEAAPQAFAAVTNAFYVNNWLHDLFYRHGFDEAAGNAQRDNLGLGGVAGDPLRVAIAGVSNNASMRTPADGASPSMSLYLFDTWATLRADLGGTTRTFVAVPPYFDEVGGFERHAPLVVSTNAGCSPTAPTMSGAVILHRVARTSSCELETLTAAAAAGGAVAVVLVIDGATEPAQIGRLDGYQSSLPTLAITSGAGDELALAVTAGPVQVHLRRPLRDSALDNTIVTHEWGHYLFRRLVAGGSGQLAGAQAGGLNEGTADFVSLVTLARADDGTTGVFPQGAYALGGMGAVDYGYFGIRRYPYTTDPTRNPLTFKHIETDVALPVGPPAHLRGSGNAEVHNAGEIWATALWGCFVALHDAHGPDEARERMLGYLVAALKLVPADPTFVDARNAFLAAAAAADAGDEERFWRAFARRGLGEEARAPSRTSVLNRGVVESFEHPYQTRILDARVVEGTQSCDADGILDAGELGELVLRVRRGAGTTEVVTTVTGTAEVSFPAGTRWPSPVGDARVFELRVPVALISAPTGGRLTLQVVAAASDREHARTVVTEVHRDLLYGTLDDVEAAPSAWGTGQPLAAGWQRTATPADGTVWRIEPLDGGERAALVSPPLTDSGSGRLRLSFDHRFATYGRDGGVIELSSDGGATWTDIGDRAAPTYPATIWGTQFADTARRGFGGRSDGYPRFSRVVLELGDAYHGQTVRLRFRFAASGDQDGRWDLDNLAVAGVQGAPFPRLAANARTCALADAGPDQAVNAGTRVELNGAGSHAYAGEVLTFAWTQVAGPAVTLDAPTAARTGFTALGGDADTELRFRLTVRSVTRGAEGTDEVTIHVRSGIVVVLPADQLVLAGSEVTVDGSQSHGSPQDVLAYEWRAYGGSGLTLVGADTSTVRFRAPDAPVSLLLSLSVRAPARNAYGSLSTWVRVVMPLAVQPTGGARVRGVGETVTLTSGVNRSGTDVAVRWSQIAGPEAVLGDVTGPWASAVMPATDVHRELRFRVDASSTATAEHVSGELSVLVAAATAGDDRDVRSGDEVALGLSQPDGLIPDLVYTWEQREGPTVALQAADGAAPRFTAPTVETRAQLRFGLVVSTPDRPTLGSDEVIVTVTPRPDVDAGPTGGATDAGPDGGAGGGADDAGGGCGCHTSGGAGAPVGLAGAFQAAVVALVLRRRRGRQR